MNNRIHKRNIRLNMNFKYINTCLIVFPSKLFSLIEATLGCLALNDPALSQETAKIMRIAQRLAKCEHLLYNIITIMIKFVRLCRICATYDRICECCELLTGECISLCVFGRLSPISLLLPRMFLKWGSLPFSTLILCRLNPVFHRFLR